MADQREDLAQSKSEIDRRHEQGGPFVQAVDATSMAMIVTDCRLPGNPIIFANAAFTALSGYSVEELIGKSYRILYGRQTDPGTARKVDEALNASGDTTMEIRLHRKDGRGLWVMQHVSVQVEDGQVRRHFASFWDIDRRVRAEREVRKAHDLMERRVARRTRELSRTVEDLRRENERRRAAEDVLRHTLEDKDALLEQREMLMREVNHRVKNTLQTVSALLSVQAGTTTEPAVAEGLKSAIGRLDRLAEVHQLLYESSELGAAISLDSYLSFLGDRLMVAAQTGGRRIALDVDVDEGRWSVEEVVPIALIVNEAVTNALKHAFPDDRPGRIKIGLHPVGQSLYELTIADDGIGASGPADRPGGLGLRLIDTFARQLRGSVQVERGNGTCVTVRFTHTEPEATAPIGQ